MQVSMHTCNTGLIQVIKHFVYGLLMLGCSDSMEISFPSLKSCRCDAHVTGRTSYKRPAFIAGLQ